MLYQRTINLNLSVCTLLDIRFKKCPLQSCCPQKWATSAWFFLQSIFVRWISDFACNRQPHGLELYHGFLARNKSQRGKFLRASNDIRTFFGGFLRTISRNQCRNITSPENKTRCFLLNFHRTGIPRANPVWPHPRFE